MTKNLNNSNLLVDHLVDISTRCSPRDDRKDSNHVSICFNLVSYMSERRPIWYLEIAEYFYTMNP